MLLLMLFLSRYSYFKEPIPSPDVTIPSDKMSSVSNPLANVTGYDKRFQLQLYLD